MLSRQGLSEIVKPIMRAARVPAALAHPHLPRHTDGSIFMARGGELSRLRDLMGHASIETDGQHARGLIICTGMSRSSPVQA